MPASGGSSAQGQAILQAAGAYEVWASGRAPMHTLGGAIMGASAAHAVASLFPTSGGVNPTFTLSALALRSVEYLLRSWSSLA